MLENANKLLEIYNLRLYSAVMGADEQPKVHFRVQMDLKSTLNLPDPNFGISMKADLASREPEIQRGWEEQRLYHRQMEARKDAPPYVLLDGPPYTNNAIHVGTAMNKILKDFVLKSKFMQGYRVPYVPGYDNHGLPIELAVQKKLSEQKVQWDVPMLRQACREHAAQYIELQTSQFKRLGIFGLWEKPYATMNYRFEAEIVRVFRRLVEADQVYRGLKPVMWSPTARTALADTEIIYAEHTSTAIYVRFPLVHDEKGWAEGLSNVFTVIWTTTPWTIPANLGVALHPRLMYVVVRVNGDHYLILKDLLEATATTVGWTEYEVVREVKGSEVEYSLFGHPLFGRESLAMLADYVTTEDGTGVVHTAPGHGREDFITGQRYGLPVLCPVDERGFMTSEALQFAGISYKDATPAVVEALRESGHLLHDSTFTHQYPHAERDEKPVIFRATEQWFVSIDDHDLRTRMLADIPKVTWVPESGEKRITAMISGRPDWCISRQRPWGVGIPVFYGAESGTPVLDPVAIEAVARLVETQGSDAWYTVDAREILPAGYSHPITGETEFRKETDVFDVWFDSGSVSLAVLEGNVEPDWAGPWPADLFLEGSDQHRGWFNVSLILGSAIKGVPPYRAVLTHGFVNDEQGRKMSKRLGNVIDPVDVCNTLGADVLRLWAASVNYVDDVPCGQNILKVTGEMYRKIRNTLRFLVSNLKDYVPFDGPLLPVDEYIVEQTELLVAEAVENYSRFDFRAVLSAVHNFCVNEISAFYIDAVKDRMYCDLPEWDSRRSAQAASLAVAHRLTLLLAPIIPHTAEETYQCLPIPNREDSVHLATFVVPSDERLAEIEGSEFQVSFAALLGLRAAVFAELETWKAGAGIKNSQDVMAHLTVDAETRAALSIFDNHELANLFKMSWVVLETGEPTTPRFEPSPYAECERSRVRRPDVQVVGEHALSARDRRALGL